MKSLSQSSRIERDERGRPVLPATTHPRYCGLRSAVDRLAGAGVPLTEPVEIHEWNGDARHGRFVQIDAATYALHVGRGCYITLDVQRDLNGVTPREAQPCILCRSGSVRQPDMYGSYNAA